MKIKPTEGFVLIKPTTPEPTTASGIVLPEVSKQLPQTGEVIAVGKMVNEKGMFIVPEYKVGDLVLYKKWEVIKYRQDNKESLFIKHKDIIAILE